MATLEALELAAADLQWALRSGRLVAPAGEPFGPSVQRTVLGLMNGTEESPASALPTGSGAVLEALASDVDGPDRADARALAASLQGLLADPGRLPTAVAAYNDFVRASTPAYLAEPPPAFLAIHQVLRWMVVQVTPDGTVR